MMSFPRVKIAQRIEPMTRWCATRTTDQLFSDLESKFGFSIVNPTDANNDRYAIRFGEMPILGVCHADTVLNDLSYQYNKRTKVVLSSELDDRLGLAGHLLMSRLWDYTVLVCDHEETGGSTAKVAESDLMRTGQEFNWIFELDRRGTDVVTYDYTCDVWDGLLEDYLGCDVSSGAFSDISYLEGLERKGFNLGIGYHREHSTMCHAKLTDTVDQLERLHGFLKAFGDVRFKHEESSYGGNYGYSSYRPTKRSTGSYYGNGASTTKPGSSQSYLSPIVEPVDEYDDIYYADGLAKQAEDNGHTSRHIEYDDCGLKTWDDLRKDIEARSVGIVVDEEPVSDGFQLLPGPTQPDADGLVECVCCETMIQADQVSKYGLEDVCTACLAWIMQGD